MSHHELTRGLSRDLCLATHAEFGRLSAVIERVQNLSGEDVIEAALKDVAWQADLIDTQLIDSFSGDVRDVCDLAEPLFINSLYSGNACTPHKLWLDGDEPILWEKKKCGVSTALSLRALQAASGITFPAGTIFGVQRDKKIKPAFIANFPYVNIFESLEGVGLYPQRFSDIVAGVEHELAPGILTIGDFKRKVEEVADSKRPIAQKRFPRLPRSLMRH